MPNALDLPTRRLVSQDDAAIIENARVPRSRFTGAWTRKTAFDAGYLVPILIDEVLPGDHLSYDVTAYVRMSTPLFPLLDNQRIDTFFFYVPSRLLWYNWARFMGEQDNPADSTAFTVPIISMPAGPQPVGSLPDHMGLPVMTGSYDVNALPFRAYNMIWNQWFRDQNLQNSVPTNETTNGPDALANYTLLRRAKAQDYFTSALPWPNKFTSPSLPMGGLAPVLGIGNPGTLAPSGGLNSVIEADGNTTSYNWYWQTWDANSLLIKGSAGTTSAVPDIYADLSQATGVAINTLRQAWLVQDLIERDARGGTRYVELIRSHFGVTNPDFRLQRPEYIGGGQSPLAITPIAQTAPTEGLTVGALGAAATAVGQHRASIASTEHGYVIGLINVRSEISYQQGLHRMWSRATRFDFYWPSLAALGEQAILLKELYCTSNPVTNDTIFGYQERWHEYRTRYSEITGIMRSTAAGTLDAWHLGQVFGSPPTLSTAFIQDTPPMARVLAAGELAASQQYLADIMIQRTAVRPLPTYGTPASMGRF